MDALIAATTSVMTTAYAAGEPVFRSHRTYQNRYLFFELEQLLKVSFPAIFVRPARADQAHLPPPAQRASRSLAPSPSTTISPTPRSFFASFASGASPSPSHFPHPMIGKFYFF